MPHTRRLVAAALIAFAYASATQAATPTRPDDPPRHREECSPDRTVSVLRQHVVWWARDPNPIALAAQFHDEGDDPERAVSWRLIVTTLDRREVARWKGVAPFSGRDAFGHIAFDGRDAGGHPLPAGLYVYRFEAEGWDGSGGFVRVVASDDLPAPKTKDLMEPNAAPTNPSVPYSFFFGTQHAHTNFSDGGIPNATCTGSNSSPHAGASPADAFSYAKTTGGLDWIGVIEHNHLVDDACGTCTTAVIRQRYQAA